MLSNYRNQIILACFVISVYLSHFFILGENTFILIHDNLDSTIVWLKTLADQKAFFASNDTPIPIFADMPRYSMSVNELNFISLLFATLPVFWAYAINSIILHFIAFAGMVLLLKKHFYQEYTPSYILIMVSLCFALLPFWPTGGMSVAGMPLTLYAFLNIRSKQSRFSDWMIIVLVPFYASFVLSFFAFIALLGVIFAYDLTVKKNANWSFFGAIVLIFSIFMVIEYRHFLNLLDPLFVTHRTEFFKEDNSFSDSISLTERILFQGQYHAESLHTWVLMPVVLLSLPILIWKKYSGSTIMVNVISGIIITSLFYGFWHFSFSNYLKNEFELLRIFNFSRVHFLQPLLWFSAFYIALLTFWKLNKFYSRKFILVALIIQIILSFYFSHFIQEYKNHGVSYKQFYSEDSFSRIKEYLNNPNVKIISVGIHPAIAQYNKLKTGDFYLANYPLEYKHQFEKTLGTQIANDPHLADYFYNSGSRLHYFTPQTRLDFIGNIHSAPIPKFLGSKEALLKLDIEYAVSRVPIEQGLNFMHKFENENSAWTLYLYSIQE